VQVLFQISFLLMLAVPTTYQAPRGALLLLLEAGVAIAIAQGRWIANRDIVVLSALTVGVSLFGMLRGLLGDAPGAIAVGSVYVVWPLAFMSFIGLATSPQLLYPFRRTIIAGACIASLMGFWVFLDAAGLHIPGAKDFLMGQGAAVGLHNGYIAYRLFNMGTLIYALPFLIALLFMPRYLSKLSRGMRWAAWIALVATSLAMLVSGRRSFWLIGMVAPLLAVFFMWVTNTLTRQTVVRAVVTCSGLLVVAILVVVMLKFKLSALVSDFVAGFDFSGHGSVESSLRASQFVDLIGGWQREPLFGAGQGMPAPHVIRSALTPWAYELSYVALLYQAGLLAFVIYALAVLWIFFAAVKLVRAQPEAAGLLIPMLVGLTGFLISNATNPYLGKFDYLWTLFLPVAVINAYTVQSRPST